MRISDWSSDVCSSDLHALLFGIAEQALLAFARRLVGRRRWTRRCRLGSRSGRGRRFGFDLWRLGLAGLAQHTTALDLDHHGIRAAVAEALLHLAGDRQSVV